MYEQIISTLKATNINVFDWKDICKDDKIYAAMEAYADAADRNDTVEMTEAIEEYYINPRTLHLIKNKIFDEMKELIEESVLNYYNAQLCDAFNSSFEDGETDIKFGGFWKLCEKIEPIRSSL